MTARRRLKPAPKGLGPAGKALWKSILDDLAPGWEFDARELHLLERACRCADELKTLEAAIDRDGLIAKGSRSQPVMHPAMQEARQLRLAQLRLLGALELTDPAANIAATPSVRRATKAAQTRWARTPRKVVG